MTISNRDIYAHSLRIIRSLYGSNAEFREGQYEAIEATMTQKRTLVVQRTGWGKSLVYFVCTKLIREQNKGLTLVVSPLLVLMQNQIEAAEKMGLRCDVLNSRVKERRPEILESMNKNLLDLVLVTPETLFSNDVQEILKSIRIGLFVIDEAHCISDWGHDFRLDYCKLKSIIAQLPANVPVLATTATANNRVISDLEQQLGQKVFISRGSLTRDSLYIQVLNIPDKISRYAWILENITKLPGSGIIYCLTQRDCDYLREFLIKNGISAEAYYSRDGEEGEKLNQQIERKFENNKIKAIVATIKLGMGYDKGDIAFVIHFQMPANIVSYYQQIGRAGRNIDKAYTFLMCGVEDKDIHNYFIQTAFPSEQETTQIMELVSKNDGVYISGIQSKLNFQYSRINKALMFLTKDGFLRTDGGKYYATLKPYVYDKEHYDKISSVRIKEMQQMQEMMVTHECYSKYIVNCLDDKTAENCGHCANCCPKLRFEEKASIEYTYIAETFVNSLVLDIKPRKMWINSDATNSKRITHQNQIGICLSKYGSAGYGTLVKRDKYSKEKRFCNELLGRSRELLRPFVIEKNITHICAVPSMRSDLVKDFAIRLADTLGLEFADLLIKSSAKQQKEMQNSAFQCSNAYKSYSVKENMIYPEKILLVDDVVDSKWTLTVCGFRLMEAGCIEVYPFALADSSQKEG